MGAGGEVVERVRDEVLAGAVGSLEEDGRGGGGGAAHHLEDALHRGGGADHVVEAVLFVELVAEVCDLAFERAGLEGLLHAAVELVEVDGLHEEVLRAVLRGGDGLLDGAERGEEDADEFGVLGLGGLQQLEAVRAGHPHVGEHEDDGGVRLKGLHGLFGVGGGGDVVAVFEGARHEVACVLFVVDDENGRFHVSLLTRFSRRGMRTVNLVPAPSLDSTSISPPCARTMRRESMRPSPVPARFVVR